MTSNSGSYSTITPDVNQISKALVSEVHFFAGSYKMLIVKVQS